MVMRRSVEEQHEQREEQAEQDEGAGVGLAQHRAHSSLRMSTSRPSATIIRITVSRSTMALAAAAGTGGSRARSRSTCRRRRSCRRPARSTVTKSPMTMVSTKIEPMTMPGLHQGRMTWRRSASSVAPASVAASISDLSMRDHRVEDRHDHEQRVEVDEAQDHREVGVEQPFLRLVDEPSDDSAG